MPGARVQSPGCSTGRLRGGPCPSPEPAPARLQPAAGRLDAAAACLGLRSRTSWATLATSSPWREKTRPEASPRELYKEVTSASSSSQLEVSHLRWNHSAWSRLNGRQGRGGTYFAWWSSPTSQAGPLSEA